jgi:hypothetical protein
MTCWQTARSSRASTGTLGQHADGTALVLVGHLDLAGNTGRDARHRRDARRSHGEVSRRLDEGESGGYEVAFVKRWRRSRCPQTLPQ